MLTDCVSVSLQHITMISFIFRNTIGLNYSLNLSRFWESHSRALFFLFVVASAMCYIPNC